MSRSKRDLTPEEQRLWARLARTVRTKKPPPAAPEPPPAKPAKKSAKTTAPPAPKPAAPRPKAPVADRGGERRVKRGQVEIAARLDLHGHTLASGEAALARFIARAPKPSTVLVITGKGRGGEEGALRRHFKLWVNAAALRSHIAGIAEAHRAHGGSGAFYVFLRRS